MSEGVPRADFDNLSQRWLHPCFVYVCMYIGIKDAGYSHNLNICSPDPRFGHFRDRNIVLFTAELVHFLPEQIHVLANLATNL